MSRSCVRQTRLYPCLSVRRGTLSHPCLSVCRDSNPRPGEVLPDDVDTGAAGAKRGLLSASKRVAERWMSDERHSCRCARWQQRVDQHERLDCGGWMVGLACFVELQPFRCLLQWR